MASLLVPGLGWFLLAFMGVFAWWKGSAAERLGASWVLAMYLASSVAMAVCFPHVPQQLLFGLDFALAMGLLVLAIRYSSLWLGAAMLLQSIALAAHAYSLIGEGLSPLHWMMLNNAISAAMVLCIIAATALSMRRRARGAGKPHPPLHTTQLVI